MRQADITVTVSEFGQVTVNGQLVAEVAVGVVDTRDDLARNLSLHRIAGRLLSCVSDATEALRAVPAKERERAATGLLDGFLDVAVPHSIPGVPPLKPSYDRTYDLAYEHGRRLRDLAGYLDAVGAGA